jgi:hypothetical protein
MEKEVKPEESTASWQKRNAMQATCHVKLSSNYIKKLKETGEININNIFI